MIQSKMESVYSSLNSPKVAASEHAGGFFVESNFANSGKICACFFNASMISLKRHFMNETSIHYLKGRKIWEEKRSLLDLFALSVEKSGV